MGFVILLCLVLGLCAGALVFLFYQRRLWVCWAAGMIVFAVCLAWFLSPVCVPISEEDVARFSPPIETRTQKGMIGQRYFQQREGKWQHCKVRISRLLYF